MSKARDLANAGTALTTVSATELGYLDGVTSAVQTQLNAKEATLPSQTGNSGKYLTTDGTNKSWATVSTGTTWTQRKLETGEQIYSIAYNGSNMYVAGGSAGALWSSPDAITWTSRTSGFGAYQINKIAYGNGLFVAVGENGTLTTSSDGITWTARTANMSTNFINSVIYANSLWVAVGEGGGATNTGGIIYSTDGITWTRKSQTPTVGTIYYDVIWNGTNWIVAASNSTNNYLYATTPSGTWTAAASGLAAAHTSLIWDGTRTIVSALGNMYFSTSSTTLSLNGTTSRYYSVQANNAWNWFYYNSKIYQLLGAYVEQITPTSTRGVYKQTPIISPTTYVGTSVSLNATGLTIFANASGIIVASDTAGIWTSF